MRKIDDDKIMEIIDGLQEDNSLIASPAVWNGLMVIRKILEASCSEPKQAVSGSVDDTINRQMAIAYACSGSVRRMDDGDWRRVEDVKRSLKTMPSALPGKWIDKGWDGDANFRLDGRGNCWRVHECSNCHEQIEGKMTKYCPNCGAKMEVKND